MPRISGTYDCSDVRAKLDVNGGTTGTIAYWQNNTGKTVLVYGLILNVTTQSSGACTLDIGPGATSSTSADTLIDGLSTASAGVFNNVNNGGTNGKYAQKIPAGEYLTVTVATGSAAALAADLYFTYGIANA